MGSNQGIGVGILGMGEFLPDQIRTNDSWPVDWRDHQTDKIRDLMATVDEAAARGAADVDPEVVRYAGPYFADLFRGAKERRVMPADMMPSDMEAAACNRALADAGISVGEVDAILGYSLVPDIATLENTGAVARKLGLRADVAALGVTAACASFLHQLRFASRLIQAGEFDKVLIYVSSGISAITDYEAPSSVVSGDGAVAAVVGRVDDGFGYVASTTSTHGEHHRAMVLLQRGAPVDARWWLGGEGPLQVRRGDAHAGHFAGSRAASVCQPTVARLLENTGTRVEDIDFMAVSQAGAWFGRALADAVGIDHSKILAPEDQFERYGHLMAGSVALNLLLARRLGRIKRGDLVLVYSPGLGFVTSAALIRWNLET